MGKSFLELVHLVENRDVFWAERCNWIHIGFACLCL